MIVSLHDVRPDTWAVYADWLPRIEAWGIDRTVLLVVPRPAAAARAGADALAAYAAALRAAAARGHEIAQHGLTHYADAVRGGPWAQLVGRVYTAHEGEFYRLAYAEAMARLREGRRALEAMGLNPRGFIAPAWLMSRAALRAAADAGFAYTTRLRAVVSLPDGRRRNAPAITLSSRSAWRRALSRVWAPTVFALCRNRPLLRLAIHPCDLAHPPTTRILERLLQTARRTHRPCTYAGLLDRTSPHGDSRP